MEKVDDMQWGGGDCQHSANDDAHHKSWQAGFDAANFRWNSAFVTAFLCGMVMGFAVATIIASFI